MIRDLIPDRDSVDDTVRSVTGGRVGISDDFTSTDDSVGQVRSPTPSRTSSSNDRDEDDSPGVRDRADSFLRRATGDRVGVSDNFRSIEDSTGRDVSISDDFTSVSDGTRSSIDDRVGASRFLETDQGRELRRDVEQSEGRLESFDAHVRLGSSFMLNHPDASFQEATRGGLSRVTGAEDDEELARQFQSVDEGITRGIDDAVEDTALDNRATDAVRWTGDTLIGEGVRTFTSAASIVICWI